MQGAMSRGGNCTFTFTLISHLGKTHNHRSRGDTPWRAQTNTPRPHTSTRVREFPGKWPPRGGSQSLPARMYRSWPAAAAPRPFSMRMSPEPDANVTPSARGTARPLIRCHPPVPRRCTRRSTLSRSKPRNGAGGRSGAERSKRSMGRSGAGWSRTSKSRNALDSEGRVEHPGHSRRISSVAAPTALCDIEVPFQALRASSRGHREKELVRLGRRHFVLRRFQDVI